MESFERQNIFDFLYERYKIKKNIRMIELFAGYGSQYLGMSRALKSKNSDLKVEHWKVSEWAVKSIQAYKDLHFSDANVDYAKDKTDEEILEWLDGRISLNYNEPIFKDKIKKQNFKKIYNNMRNSKNLGSICKINGSDLEINDRNYEYIMTYSFPCQDLSRCGKRNGINENTRSGLLYEVERLLDELAAENKLPNILLLENVPDLISNTFKEDFYKWEQKLSKLNYSNFVKVLEATDFGIPQTRKRVFMVSILGECSYEFPCGFKLTKRLKDFLEDEVDEKYYISDRMIQGMKNTKFESYKLENKLLDEDGVASTIIARFEGAPQLVACEKKKNVTLKRESCNKLNKDGVVVLGNYMPSNHNASRIVDSNYVVPTVMENHGTITAVVEEYPKILDDRDKGFGVKESNICPTLRAERSGLKVMEKAKVIGGIGEKKSNGGAQYYQQDRIYKGDIALTLPANLPNGSYNYEMPDLRIRKLTPKECGRLMGVDEESIDKISKNQSNSSLYHLFGDSIVVDVLEYIFKEML